MVLAGVKQGVAAVLNDKPGSRNEVRDVPLVAGHRAKVFITETVIKIKLLCDLPGILEVSIESIRVYKALRISDRDGGGRYVAGKKVRQGTEARIGNAGRTTAPRSLSAVEDKLPCSTPVIELIDGRSANLCSITELVAPNGMGNDVADVPCQVTAAFRRSQPGLLKPTNPNVRRSEDGLPVIGRIGTEEQAQSLGIKAIVVVMEELVEVAGAEKQLIGQPRCQR